MSDAHVDSDADLDAMLEVEEARLEEQTDEGAQEMRPVHRDGVIGGGLWREDGVAVLIHMGPPRRGSQVCTMSDAHVDPDADLDAMPEVEEARLEQQTDEGAQEMRPVHRDVVIGGGLWPEDDETMIINMGPQHPSTHGVLRVMMELDGETVLRASPVIGYLHTGMEQTGEEPTYVQGSTNVTRMDYLGPLSNELVFSMAVERLLDVDVPPRATWIRMLLVELNRIASHLLFQATNGLDLGAISMMLYGWREREEVLRFLEMVTGLRMNHNYIRPGGVAADLPDGWRDSLLRVLEPLPERIDEFDTLMTNQPIWRE